MSSPAANAFLVFAAGLFLGAAGPRASAGEVSVLPVRPSETDPAIRRFDAPHRIYQRTGEVSAGEEPPRQQLLLWIPGTAAPAAAGKAPADPERGREGAEAFCRLAARLGYQVISLRYPNDTSASVARRDPDAAEFERFRLALIRGGKSKYLTVDRADSIEHRLISLLRHLVRLRPAEGWERYLTDEGSLRWEAIAVAGQSQGGGHAALIGLHHRVARVICTGAPKDYSLALDAPAPWLTRESATPRSRFFAFNHLQDRQAANAEQQLANLRALGLDRFGPPVKVEDSAPPFGHTRILTTNYPGGTVTSQEAHTSVISWRNEKVFAPVWRYLLTEPVE